MKSKRKISILKIFVFLMFIFCVIFLVKGVFFRGVGASKGFISSVDSTIKLYNENFEEIGTISRGTEIKVFNSTVTKENNAYKKIIYNNKTYLINVNSTSKTYEESIQEKELYVRTSVTVYKSNESQEILGYLPKSSKIDILGFDKIIDGVVNKYKIKYNETEGYVVGKYLVNTQELADANYNENGIYDIHKDRKYSMELYGGQASDLDYYPYAKANFENNNMPDETKTLYLNATASTLNNIDAYIELAKNSSINAFVVDIKDGFLAYESAVAKEYSPTAFSSAARTIEEYKAIIDKIKANDFYVIGRIVAFNDSHFAKDNEDAAISHNGENTGWTSAFSRKAWEYNVLLAKEALQEFGFNEIQYDYVRFPDSSYSMSKSGEYDFKNIFHETKAQAVQNFLFYAADQIHGLNAYLSVDVFGECANTYVTAYGQYWPAISNIVDVISAMPYPDHFNKYDYGFKEPVWTKPYELLTKWGSSAATRQTEIPTPAKARTWIQAYNAIHEPKIEYDASMVEKELQALYDSNLTNGFITWNSKSSLTKYQEIAEAFKKNYR